MAPCGFCKVASQQKLKNCVCGRVSYCSKECQAKDWRSHKSSCPPFTTRELPAKDGRLGLFATRKINPGKLILEELPVFTTHCTGVPCQEIASSAMSKITKLDCHTRAKLLKLRDPADNIKDLEADNVKFEVENHLISLALSVTPKDVNSKIFRIFSLKCVRDENSSATEGDMFYQSSFINHSCNPNATKSPSITNNKKLQVWAMKVIQKDEEIVVNGKGQLEEFNFGNREFRQRMLLKCFSFQCQCSECSLQGEALRENERTRAEIREKRRETEAIMKIEYKKKLRNRSPGSVRKAIKLSQDVVELVKKLGLLEELPYQLLEISYPIAKTAKFTMGLRGAPDPQIFKREALEYCKNHGDVSMWRYNNADD